jgi:hypothetical protein
MAGAAVVPDLSGISSDASAYFNSPDYSPVVPDVSNLDLPGQFDSMPGGASTPGGFYSSDPSGANVIYIDHTADPNATGGWQNVASQVLSLASKGMSAFASGGPSPAVPPARRPLNSPTTFALPGTSGQTNWLLVGGIIVGVAGLAWAVAVL